MNEKKQNSRKVCHNSQPPNPQHIPQTQKVTAILNLTCENI